MSNPFISHYYTFDPNLPPYSQKLQEYWVAANGVFLRSHRPELEICLPIARTKIPGLAEIQPYLKLNVPRVPASMIADIVNTARVNPHQEILFYLGVENNRWWLHTPMQEASSTHVRSLQQDNPKYRQALVEVHSHGCMKAIPSSQDNQEEAGKFRVFAIVGTVNTTPTIYSRLGIYNHFFEIAPNFIFEP
ncbi:hypothetical protein CEN49_01245 [Fischerella thermalis CCMEE 5273]|uniref:JAB domain-containing protein n=1 Tax=Chlorogloeopsis fritschii PCC 6912 TaxID=211165 RepID=A0A3S0Y437_CHLFR|nr:Mov34/MPN/PAD-1 family protein [Chlorogloeopsis fritschii]PMB11642.1 hypothetical protein CEN49_01245 [Fischerella thermalis CCMEE 5273]PMB46194.1 hypothetical protein CEN40_10750 [Fischerella thermalis CCMEE 5205]RUR83816.1 hypothetical protein PCC6912_20590 [Chlorogloeopsis fritschii PCC 6912]